MHYKFKKGITDSQTDQLVKYSLSDPAVLKFTSDPVRFKNKKSATRWLAGVTPYTLSDKDGNLLGITWFHEKLLPERKFSENLNSSDFPLTFAIRVYGEARGKGMSYDFMKKSFEAFYKRHPELVSGSEKEMPKPFDKTQGSPREFTPRGKQVRHDKMGIWVETSFDNVPTIKLAKKFGFKKVSEPDERGKIIMVRNPL